MNETLHDAETASTNESLAKFGRPADFPRLALALAGVCALVTSTGCQLPSHQEQKLQAQQDWRRLRAEFKVRLGRQQFDDGLTDEAIASLQEAAALDPTGTTHHLLMARCYLEQGALDSALETTDQARRLGDASAELAYTRGMIAERRSRYESALVAYREAARLEPTNVDYALATAECLVTAGRAIEAQAFLDEQLRRLPGSQQLLLLRARICAHLGDLEQAATDFEAVDDVLPDTRWAAEEYGLVLVRLSRHAQALAVLRPLLESADRSSGEQPAAMPMSPAGVRALATCYRHTGTVRRAKALLEDHLRQSPKDARAWWLLAESFIEVGDWDGARRCLLRGEQVAPQMSDWKLLRAYLAWHDGDLANTAIHLELILREDADDVLAHCFLGQVCERRNEPDRARAHYEIALRIDPHDPWALAGLREMPCEE